MLTFANRRDGIGQDDEIPAKLLALGEVVDSMDPANSE